MAQFLVVLAMPLTHTMQKVWPHSSTRGRVTGPRQMGHSDPSSSELFSWSFSSGVRYL